MAEGKDVAINPEGDSRLRDRRRVCLRSCGDAEMCRRVGSIGSGAGDGDGDHGVWCGM